MSRAQSHGRVRNRLGDCGNAHLYPEAPRAPAFMTHRNDFRAGHDDRRRRGDPAATVVRNPPVLANLSD